MTLKRNILKLGTITLYCIHIMNNHPEIFMVFSTPWDASAIGIIDQSLLLVTFSIYCLLCMWPKKSEFWGHHQYLPLSSNLSTIHPKIIFKMYIEHLSNTKTIKLWVTSILSRNIHWLDWCTMPGQSHTQRFLGTFCQIFWKVFVVYIYYLLQT